MRVVFWAPASSQIGGGHSTRCFALAEALAERGAGCMFLVDEETSAVVTKRLEQSTLHSVAIDRLTASSAAAVCRRTSADWIVFDDYRISAAEEGLLRDAVRYVLVIDDLADRPHDCDALLDTMPYRAAAAYCELVPAGAELWIGRDYTLIRRSIMARRDASLDRRNISKISRILVTLGMTNTQDTLVACLQALTRIGAEAEIDVIVGNDDAAEMLRGATLSIACPVNIHVNIPDPADLFVRADLAITAPGVTALELCTLGVPTVLIQTYAHQHLLGDYLDRTGAAILIGSDGLIENLRLQLQNLLSTPSALASLSAKGAAQYDGRGADKVAALMTNAEKNNSMARNERV